MNKIKEYTTIFLFSITMLLLIIIPGVIAEHGFFIFAGDYSFQYIPFYYHLTETIHTGALGWDWITNLGSDFIGSYSYYSLGSVFFWIVGWIKSGRVVMYLTPFILALKFGTASVTSYIYIRRYINDKKTALLGCIMYTFSGFQLVSVVCFQFSEAIALFPLLLFSFDLLVIDNKKVFFLIMVTVTAFDNYYFFYCQALFIFILYIFRCLKKINSFSWKTFFIIFFESCIGVLLSSVLLLPSIVSVFSGGRSTFFLNGTDLVSYRDNTIIPSLLQSAFMFPDPCGRYTLFGPKDNQWSSASLYLPGFALTGVFEYIRHNKNHWISSFLCVCGIIAFVPVFNSAFSLFNDFYYARWLFMPALFMCIATCRSIENKYDFKYGIKIHICGVIIFFLISLLPDKTVESSSFADIVSSSTEEKIRWLSMDKLPSVFLPFVAFSLAFGLIIYYTFTLKKFTLKKFCIYFISFTVISSAFYLEQCRQQIVNENLDYRETTFDYTPELENDCFFRINDVNNSLMNNYFVWGYPSISSFHSLSIEADETFYSNVATESRRMRSIYTEDDYPVYGLLSVRYIFNHSTGDDLNVENYSVNIPGFSLYDKQSYYYIYKNDYFVPMGFMYDYCITDKRLRDYIIGLDLPEDADKTHYLQKVLMRALIMSEEDQEKYSAVIKPLPDDMLANLDSKTYLDDCGARAASACEKFDYNSDGFKAEISSDKSGIVFFSVPVYKGWSAEVNGIPTEIIRTQYGFSAVKVPSGNSVIEFKYKTYGLKEGIILTIAGLAIFVIYLICVILRNSKSKGGRSLEEI